MSDAVDPESSKNDGLRSDIGNLRGYDLIFRY